MPVSTAQSLFKIVKEVVYDKCGFDLTNLQLNAESAEYGACSFQLNGKSMQYRVSKITPTKTGQFVTIWKRDEDGITAPFHISDDLDFILITSKSADQFGQFIFPKAVLVKNGIISTTNKQGKRGIRVYPPWDAPTNRLALQTQNWQSNYFFAIKNDDKTNLNLVKTLFSIE